jgi:hypothetical protein
VVDRRADAAAIKAIASGSRRRTMSVISHRVARSLSVSSPTNAATYRMGAASVSILRSWAAPLADCYQGCAVADQVHISPLRYVDTEVGEKFRGAAGYGRGAVDLAQERPDDPKSAIWMRTR